LQQPQRLAFPNRLEGFQKSCGGTQLLNPSIFLLITPREQTTLHPKGKLLMALNMFVRKKFGQTTKCFEETGNSSCNWVRLLLYIQTGTERCDLKYIYVCLAISRSVAKEYLLRSAGYDQ
jgi:hypothetical protein